MYFGILHLSNFYFFYKLFYKKFEANHAKIKKKIQMSIQVASKTCKCYCERSKFENLYK